MMSLYIADALRHKLQEEHDFNAEQANGTLLVVDEMVDSGIDRVLDSIASLRSDMDAKFKVIDDRLIAIDDRFKTTELWLPIKSAFFTLTLLAAAVAIFGQ